MQYTIGYRRDIDGLRALAVLSVVFYHYGVPGFRGGFSGVDVFFVISGFLIGGHIADEIMMDRFSLLAFYERRIRRILPALFCTVALALLAAPAILYPPDFRRLVRVALSVIPFLANVEIYATLRSYSGQFVQNSPLAHTWSLAVEEQFYLLFPLLMLVAARFSGRRYAAVLAPLALLSFAACVVASRIAPISDFFLAPFRVWELLVGALLAAGKFELPHYGMLPPGVALLGLVLIASADLFLGRSTPYPSEYALLPCGGAALLILAACDRRWVVGQFLDNPAARYIGLWSYSLYLVHWPLLVFTQYYFYWPLSVPVRALLLAMSFGLAALSWRFVEQPFRDRRKLFSGVRIYALAAGAAIILVGATLALRAFDRPNRFFPAPTQSQAACGDLSPEMAARTPACKIGGIGPVHAVLWGDSHAHALIPGVAAAFRAHGDSAMVFARASCPPVLDVEFETRRSAGLFAALGAALDRQEAGCSVHNDQALHWIARHRIPAVILAAHWIVYADTDKVPNAAASHLALVDRRSPGAGTGAAVFSRNFSITLDALKRLRVRVFVVEDAPQNDIDVPYVLAADFRLGRMGHHEISRAAYDAQQRTVTRIFDRLQKLYGFEILRPQDLLCAGGRCALTRNGQMLYQDKEHLSPSGALAVAPAFAPVWR